MAGALGLEMSVADFSAELDKLAACKSKDTVEWHDQLEGIIKGLDELVKLKPRNAKAKALASRALLGSKREQATKVACEYAQSAVELNPDAPWAHLCLAQALGKCQGQLSTKKKAIQSYRRAIELSPTLAQAHSGLVQLVFQDALDNKNDESKIIEVHVLINEAVSCIQGAEQPCRKTLAELFYTRARAFRRQRKLQDCLVACKAALEQNPSHELAEYLMHGVLVAINETNYISPTNGKVPTKAPEKYVKQLYDSYAKKFDEHLVQMLEYRTPTLLAAAIRASVQQTEHVYQRTADLGCGTGLGMLQLVKDGLCLPGGKGVDLSGKMVDKAKELNIYSSLYVDDVLTFLQTEETQVFDFVLSSDVFVYIGDLSGIFKEVARTLQPAGVFAFSVETAAEGDGETAGFRLLPTRRFAHTTQYVRDLCNQNGLREVRVEEGTQLRRQAGQPVLGTLFVVKKEQGS